MELVILLAKDDTIFSQGVSSIKKKLKRDYSENEIEECLYDLYIDIKAEQCYYNIPNQLLFYD